MEEGFDNWNMEEQSTTVTVGDMEETAGGGMAQTLSRGQYHVL